MERHLMDDATDCLHAATPDNAHEYGDIMLHNMDTGQASKFEL